MADTKLILAIFVSLIIAVSSQATCAGYRCPFGKICGYKQVTCAKAPCNPVRTCMTYMDYFSRCPRTCGRNRCVLPIGTGKGSCHVPTSNSDRCPGGKNPLSIGGSQVFCGRGPTRQDCPSTHFCHISPTDRFAFCCSKKKPVDTCPAVQCTIGFCFRGWKKDTKGCRTCTCCPFRFCRNHCPNGYKTSPDGCRTCQCKGGVDTCPAVQCTTRFCFRGWKKDTTGCQTCTCCPFRFCRNHCPNGYNTSPDGCRTCQCKGGVCPLLRCMTPKCPFGILKDSRGCNTCSCNPKPCRDAVCKRLCPYGFKRSKYGCTICECNSRPMCPLVTPCPTVKCANGRVKDIRGCDTCRCRSTHCIPYMCARPLVPCRLGMKLDSKGCPTCDCKDSECPLIKCSTSCRNGYMKDKNGCNTCRCRPILPGAERE